VREQEVDGGRIEFQQRLIGGDRIIPDVDRAQQTAVALVKVRRVKQGQPPGDGVEAVTAVGVAAIPPGGLGITVQADAHLDLEFPEDVKHLRVEQSPVGLHSHVHRGGHPCAELRNQLGQPARSD
jgi:hypothetical protein